jgi:hypothetical protein
MKSEVTIDGVTYKVGDVLEGNGSEYTILAVGDSSFFLSDAYGEHTLLFSAIIFGYKIKKKTKKIALDIWVNIYSDGKYYPYESEEVANGQASASRVACENIKHTVEI